MAYTAGISLIAILVGIQAVWAVKFHLPAGESRCLGEDVEDRSLMKLKYSIEPDHQGVLQVTLNSPQRTQLWSKNGAVKASYATTAQASGEHSVCFSNVGVVQILVDFSFESGADAENDYADVAKKENLKPVEIELRRMEDTVKHIRSEMTYMRTREEQMRNTNEGTNARVLWFSVLSMIILVALGAWQLYYLKKFFTAKKMI